MRPDTTERRVGDMYSSTSRLTGDGPRMAFDFLMASGCQRMMFIPSDKLLRIGCDHAAPAPLPPLFFNSRFHLNVFFWMINSTINFAVAYILEKERRLTELPNEPVASSLELGGLKHNSRRVRCESFNKIWGLFYLPYRPPRCTRY